MFMQDFTELSGTDFAASEEYLVDYALLKHILANVYAGTSI